MSYALTQRGEIFESKQLIDCFPSTQESKFLGGDMEHTHLVKGLDFALLQKVRSEIYNLEKEDNAEEESGGGGDNRKARRAAAAKKGESANAEEADEVDPVVELQKQCRTNVARNIVR